MPSILEHWYLMRFTMYKNFQIHYQFLTMTEENKCDSKNFIKMLAPGTSTNLRRTQKRNNQVISPVLSSLLILARFKMSLPILKYNIYVMITLIIISFRLWKLNFRRLKTFDVMNVIFFRTKKRDSINKSVE